MRADLSLRWLWASGGALMIGTVLLLCLLPAPDIAPIARFLPDKVEHSIAFFGMTLWYCGVYPRSNWWKIFLLFILLGAGIEFAQAEFTTTRAADVRDWLADCIGIGLAGLLAAAGLANWPYWVERLLGFTAREP